jgi:hypothetical protein
MKKRVLFLCLTLTLALAAGCFSQFEDELYRLPQMPAEMRQLQSLIERELTGGAQYAPPASGTNRQPVQIRQDGGEEIAVVFLRFPGETAPRVRIYTKADGEFVFAGEIEGVGDQVDRVDFTNLYGGGIGILLSWRLIGSSLRALSVYYWAEGALAEVFTRNIDNYTLVRSENVPDSLLLITLAAGEQPGMAEWHLMGEDGFTAAATAPLSDGMRELKRIRLGTLADGALAAFVTGELYNGLVITDIFAFADEQMRNITYDDAFGQSLGTMRRDIVPVTAIDDVVCLPQPVHLPLHPDSVTWDLFERIDWYVFDSTGAETLFVSTVHKLDAGWYFILPEGWGQGLVLSRDDSRSALGERVLHLYFYEHIGSPVRLASFFSLTGTARARAMQSAGAANAERVLILELSEVAIAATLYELPDWLAELTVGMDDLKAAVRAIEPEWFSFEVN